MTERVEEVTQTELAAAPCGKRSGGRFRGYRVMDMSVDLPDDAPSPHYRFDLDYLNDVRGLRTSVILTAKREEVAQ